MDAPIRSNKPVERVPLQQEVKSHGQAERVGHVANPALRKAMAETTLALAKKPLLASFVKPQASLEENFFRLMDAVHVMARVIKVDKSPQGSDQEQLEWECKNLPRLADYLPLEMDKQFLHQAIRLCSPNWRLAIDLIDRAPKMLQQGALEALIMNLGEDEPFETVMEIAGHFQPLYDKALPRYDGTKNYSLVHKFAFCFPNTMSRISMLIALDIIENQGLQGAKKYLSDVSPKDQGKYLPKISLAKGLQIAEEDLPFGAFLAKTYGWGKQYDKMIALFSALPSGEERDKEILSAIKYFFSLKDDQPKLAIAELAQLLSDPDKRIEIDQKLKAKIP